MSVDALLRLSGTRQELSGRSVEDTELRTLFHRLNNQLGVALAHAELLEAKAPDQGNRARSAQVVAATLEAMTLARAIRARIDQV